MFVLKFLSVLSSFKFSGQPHSVRGPGFIIPHQLKVLPVRSLVGLLERVNSYFLDPRSRHSTVQTPVSLGGSGVSGWVWVGLETCYPSRERRPTVRSSP